MPSAAGSLLEAARVLEMSDRLTMLSRLCSRLALWLRMLRQNQPSIFCRSSIYLTEKQESSILFLKFWAVARIHPITSSFASSLSSTLLSGEQALEPHLLSGSKLSRCLSILQIRELNFFLSASSSRYFLVSLSVLLFLGAYPLVQGLAMSVLFILESFKTMADYSGPNTELYASFLVMRLYFCTKDCVPFLKLLVSQCVADLGPAVANFFLKSSFLSLSSKIVEILSLPESELSLLLTLCSTTVLVIVLRSCCCFFIWNSRAGSMVKLSFMMQTSLGGRRSAKKFFRFCLLRSRQFLCGAGAGWCAESRVSWGQPASWCSLLRRGLVLAWLRYLVQLSEGKSGFTSIVSIPLIILLSMQYQITVEPMRLTFSSRELVLASTRLALRWMAHRTPSPTSTASTTAEMTSRAQANPSLIFSSSMPCLPDYSSAPTSALTLIICFSLVSTNYTAGARSG